MRRYLGYALLSIFVITLLIWGVSQYIQPILPRALSSNLLLFITISLGVVSTLALFKDVVGFFEIVLERPNKYTKLSIPSQQNREMILGKVENFWVKNLLESSVHQLVLVEVEMEYKPDAVSNPWDGVLQKPSQSRITIPNGTSILQVFEDTGRELLILGEPGSGKTTSTLILTRDLIAQARRDTNNPIPIIFNLSSWANRRKTIENWLIEEFKTRYSVPSKVSENWIENDNLILILDGFDEVQVKFRIDCADALNSFRQEHGLMPIVVCSRVAEYDATKKLLNLQSAITLKPLVTSQIDKVFKSLGPEARQLHDAIRSDENLQELVKSPLMLLNFVK